MKDPIENHVTPKHIFENRRTIIKTAAAGLMGTHLSGWFNRNALAASKKLNASLNPNYSVLEKKTSYEDITNYNNFYEFGLNKEDPALYAHTLQTYPWQISIEGLVHKPKIFSIDELLKLSPLEERIYRMRCVEGWSMVIPWIGYSLSNLIKLVNPMGSAKYVEFVSLADKNQMPEIRNPIIAWPYTEALRLDEAMHPLTLLTLGLYGEVLPKQNGAPVRITVPWKYGFKSAKSIVKIRFTENQPKTSWNQIAPREYGFYSNVNPEVDHPRWSQATERRIGDAKGPFAPKIKTLMFNGYSDQVASLYAGMDLKKFY